MLNISLIKKAFFIYAAQGIAALSGLAFSYLVARNVSKEQAGNAFYFLAIGTILTNLVSAPLGIWLTRISGLDKRKSELRAVMQLWVNIGLSFLIAAVVFFWGGLYNESTFLLFVASGVVSSSYLYEWNSRNNYKLYSWGSVSIPLLRLGSAASLIYMFPGLVSIEFAVTFASVVSLVSFKMVCQLSSIEFIPRRLSFHINRRHLRIGGRLAIYMGGSSLIFSAYQALDKTLVKEIWGPERAAELIVCLQWSYSIVTTAMQPVVAIIYPRILQSRENFATLVSDNMRAVVVLIVVFAVASAIINWAVVGFLPDNYVHVSKLLWVGILSGAFFVIGQMVSISFSKEGAEYMHILSVAIPVLITTPVMYLLIKSFDVAGALYSGLIFSVVYLAGCCVLTLRFRNEH